MEEGDAEGEGPMVGREGPNATTTTTTLLASVKEQVGGMRCCSHLGHLSNNLFTLEAAATLTVTFLTSSKDRHMLVTPNVTHVYFRKMSLKKHLK